MKMTITAHSLQDRETIQAAQTYMSAHPSVTAYHHIAWLQAVETTYQHSAVIFIAQIDSNIIGVIPMIHMRRPLLGACLCALPYCDMGHALADDDSTVQALTDYVRHYANANHVRHIEYRNGLAQQPISKDELAAFTGQKITMKMPLADNAQAQMDSYKSKLRSQIRKAQKNGLSVKLSTKTTLLDDFYRVFSHNMRDLGSPTHSKCWFANIMSFYQNRACMAVVYHADHPIGAGIILLQGELCSIPWASTINQFNHLAPNMLLYAELIGYAADHNMRQFDFGRSTLNEGTYRFKKQWGAQPYPLQWSDLRDEAHAPSSKAQRTPSQKISTSKIKPTLIKVWRKLPLAITTRLGSQIRGYISL